MFRSSHFPAGSDVSWDSPFLLMLVDIPFLKDYKIFVSFLPYVVSWFQLFEIFVSVELERLTLKYNNKTTTKPFVPRFEVGYMNQKRITPNRDMD